MNVNEVLTRAGRCHARLGDGVCMVQRRAQDGASVKRASRAATQPNALARADGTVCEQFTRGHSRRASPGARRWIPCVHAAVPSPIPTDEPTRTRRRALPVRGVPFLLIC